jgi:hypothetical protein
MVSYGHQVYQIDFLSSPNKWKNRGGEHDDYAYLAHVQLQESM